MSCLVPYELVNTHNAEREVLCVCLSGLGTCPYSYSLIGWWQERLAEVNSGKRIYHSAVAPNAFQMMCPWDARLLPSPSPLARNSLCNYSYYWMGLTTKGLVDVVLECVVTQKVCLPSDIVVWMNFPKLISLWGTQLIKTAPLTAFMFPITASVQKSWGQLVDLETNNRMRLLLQPYWILRNGRMGL